PDPAPVLATMARRLQAAGACALAMPCNTAHHYAPAITGAVTIPFLDMIELSAARTAQSAPPGASVGLLASPAVRRTGLFDAALARRGLHALWPGDGANDQGGLLEAIRLIKAEGATDRARALLQEASHGLARRGAGLQLVACSELSLIAGSVAPDVTSLDTLDVLVDAITDFSLAPAATSPAPGAAQ
ncbi:MAG TPA: aspartate/glutamate racemase family protein, partial [Aliiroseovarius sp.]|nr:aspartate/glutamate racemase family protein [Aliiroseovarius sp.]